MGRSRFLILRRNWQRRLISLAVLVSLCAVIFPLPIGWQNRSQKDLSQPFPCQNRPCGCRTADQCWKKCCCFTNSQKVAWAKAQRVQVPEAVVASAKLECSRTEQGTGGCCHVATSKETQADSDNASAEESRETIYVIAALAQQCQGQPWSWSTLPWAILAECSECHDISPVVGEKIGLCSATSTAFCRCPPVPPPRHSSDSLLAV